MIAESSELNRFRKLKTKAKLVVLQKKILKKCKQLGVFPKFMEVRTSVINCRSTRAELWAKQKWLESEVSYHYSKLEAWNQQLYNLHLKITKGLDGVTYARFAAFKSHMEEVIDHKCTQKWSRQNRKLEWLKRKIKPTKTTTHVRSIPDFVHYLSCAKHLLITLEDLSLVKRVDRPQHLDAWESKIIRKNDKKHLLNEDYGNIESSLINIFSK
jgi:hypothetical protein